LLESNCRGINSFTDNHELYRDLVKAIATDDTKGGPIVKVEMTHAPMIPKTLRRSEVRTDRTF